MNTGQSSSGEAPVLAVRSEDAQQGTGHSTAPAPTVVAKSGSYAADVLRVASGASFAQLFSIIAAPVLSRMFPPESFGIMAVYTSIIGTAGVVMTLRYDQAIMLPEGEDDAANVFALAILVTLVISGAIGLVTLFWGRSILNALAAGPLVPYRWIIPVSILISGLYQSVLMWNSRRKRFSIVAGARALSSGISNSLQLGGGGFGLHAGMMLISGAFVGNVSALGFAARDAWSESGRRVASAIRIERLRWAAYRYRELPLFNTWSVLLNTLSWQMPALLLARFFGTASAGYFSIGMRVLSIPMDVLAVSIGQVLFQRAAAAHADGTLGSVVEASTARLLKFSLFPILSLGLIAPDLFSIVLGSKWHEGGVYVRILAPWLCVWFLASPLSVLFNVLERQRFGLIINIVICVTRLASLYVGHLWNNIYLALGLFAASGLVVYGWLCIALVRGSGAKLRHLLAPTIKALAAITPIAFALRWAIFHHVSPAARTLIVVIPVALYFTYEVWRDAAVSTTLTARFRLKGQR